MKYECYMIFDTQAEFFKNPFLLFMTNGEAIGSFMDGVNDESTYLFHHSERYNLYHFGSFDNCSGAFDLFDAPVCKMKGFEVPRQGKRASVVNLPSNNGDLVDVKLS